MVIPSCSSQSIGGQACNRGRLQQGALSRNHGRLRQGGCSLRTVSVATVKRACLEGLWRQTVSVATVKRAGLWRQWYQDHGRMQGLQTSWWHSQKASRWRQQHALVSWWRRPLPIVPQASGGRLQKIVCKARSSVERAIGGSRGCHTGTRQIIIMRS